MKNENRIQIHKLLGTYGGMELGGEFETLCKLHDELLNTLDKIEKQCTIISGNAHEGDKVICGLGQITKMIAVARSNAKAEN